MAFSLDEVVPWGRSYREYVSMFSLSDEDTEKRILGCGDGPASFNAVLSGKGGRVVSADPLYRNSPKEIRRRILETRETVLDQTRKNAREFVWRTFRTVEDLGRARFSAMEGFLSDFPRGLREERYVDASLPVLPFPDRAFDLALCSHFLFLYSEHLSLEFHVRSLVELCRVAPTVRIFPLLELGAQNSRHLDPVLSLLTDKGYSLSILPVDYEFQKGGNRMLEVTFPA